MEGMKNGKVRFAIVGADFSLRAYMAMWSPKDISQLVAVCDRNQAMLDAFKAKYGYLPKEEEENKGK